MLEGSLGAIKRSNSWEATWRRERQKTLHAARDGFMNRCIALRETLLLIIAVIFQELLSSCSYVSQAAHLLVEERSSTLENLAVRFEPVGPLSLPAPTLCHFINTNCWQRGGGIVKVLTCLSPLCLPGLHVDHVLPTILAGQASGLPRDPSQPDPGQQGRRPAVGPRHLLPQWQEVFCSRRHCEEPHDPPASRWDCSLRPQVGCDSRR